MNIVSPTRQLPGPGNGQSVPVARDGLAANTHDVIYVLMLREVEAMALHATGDGLPLPPELMTAVDRALSTTVSVRTSPDQAPAAEPETLFVELASAHAALTRIVAPARPASLQLMMDDQRRHPLTHSFGGVPLVRRMMAVAVLSLFGLLGMALFEQVTAENLGKGLLNLSGFDLMVNEAFLIFAASVGAALANLKRLDRYIAACTYDPRNDSSYWTRLVMGLISGTVLSQIVYGELVGRGLLGNPPADNVLTSIGPPVLALLGGFSADLVHDLLTHFIDVVGQAFGRGRSGDPKLRPPA